MSIGAQRDLLRRTAAGSIFPFGTAGSKVTSYILDKYRSAQNTPAGSAGQAALQQPLSDEERGRMRFSHSWQVPKSFLALGPRWGRGLSLYFHVLPVQVRRELEGFFLSRFDLRKIPSSAGVSSFLKVVGDTAKQLGPEWSSNWRYYVNMETLGGYCDPLPIDTQISELRKWATGDAPHLSFDERGNPSEDVFIRDLRAGMSEFLRSGRGPRMDRVLDLSTFVHRAGVLMGNGATSSDNRIRYTIGRKLRNFPKTKTTSVAGYTPTALHQYILTYQPQDNVPIMKRETAKVRSVVRADDHLYFQMAYVAHFLEIMLQGSPQTPLFMTTKQRQRMWAQFSAQTNEVYPTMPLDQSHFDWQANFRMLEAATLEIDALIREYAPAHAKPDLLAVNELIRRELTDGRGTITVHTSGNEVVKIIMTKGVMSGWRWTALLDTMLNVGELYAARQLVMRQGFSDPVLSFVAQGDDDQVRVRDYVSAELLYRAYARMGFEVNPHKFFVDVGRDEFLRQVPMPSGVYGYPARAINAILWRNPVTRELPSGAAAVRQILDAWNTLAARGADHDVCWNLALQDASGRTAKSADVISAWAHTPSAVGGLGLRPYAAKWVVLRDNGDVEDWHVLDTPPIVSTWRAALERVGVPASVASLHLRRRLGAPAEALKGNEIVVETVTPDITAIPYPRGGSATRVVISDAVLDPELHQDVKDYCLRYKQEDLLLALLTEESRSLYLRAKARFSPSLLQRWVLDRLPGGPPIVWGRSKEQVASLYAAELSSIVNRALTLSKCSVHRFRAMCLSAEDQVHSALGRLTFMSG